MIVKGTEGDIKSLPIPPSNVATLDYDFSGIRGTFKLSIWVPTESVGKVIGKKGVVIQHIQLETKTTCSIISVQPPPHHAHSHTASDTISSSGVCDPNSSEQHQHEPVWSPIVISGDPANTLMAHNMIQDIVEEIDDAVGEFATNFRHRVFHGLFYGGNHHDEVKLLSAETSVRIHIPERDRDSGSYGHGYGHGSAAERSGGSGPLITLEGEAANIFRALATFSAVASDPQYATAPRKSHTPLTIPSSVFASQPESSCRLLNANSGAVTTSRSKAPNSVQHRYEQYVNIPSNLLGLLLAKRETDPNVMKQIKLGTDTQIVMLDEPVVPAAGDEAAATAATEGVTTAERTGRESSSGGGGKNSRRPIETFAVRGHSSVAVELAATCLARIVAGEKIVNVLSELKTSQKSRELRAAGANKPRESDNKAVSRTSRKSESKTEKSASNKVIVDEEEGVNHVEDSVISEEDVENADGDNDNSSLDENGSKNDGGSEVPSFSSSATTRRSRGGRGRGSGSSRGRGSSNRSGVGRGVRRGADKIGNNSKPSGKPFDKTSK